MAGELGSLSILIVCEHREDRRALFDAFDGLQLGSLYTARSVDQAAEFLREIHIDLLVLELGFEPDALSRLLDSYFSSPEGLILAVMPPPERRLGWSWEFLPPRVTECVQSPVDTDEVLFRLHRMFGDPSSGASRAAVDEGEAELLFESSDDACVFSDPRSGQILAVNGRFLDGAGGDEPEWVGQDFELVGLLPPEGEGKRIGETLRTEGQVRYRALRKRPQGDPLPVEVSQRLGMWRGRLVYLTRIRDAEREEFFSRGLRRLGALFPAGREFAVEDRIAELVDGWLKLDYFMAGAVTRNQGVRVMAAHSRGPGAERLADPAEHLPYRRLLQGEAVLAASGAAAAIGNDPFLVENRIEAYFGLPVFSSRHAVIGVLIAAAQRPVPEAAEAEGALRAIAGLLGLRWEVRKLRARSESQGLHDALTGLPNRMLFDDRLAHALNEARRTGEMVALMFVDLDRFKTINDSLGHAVGDQILTGVARRLRKGVRSSDTVARYAGDEFTIVLRHVVQKDDVLRVAQKINRLLAVPLQVPGQGELQVTASIGVSFYPDDGRTAAELIKHADMAMYGAKSMGRNTWQHYVEKPDESQQQKLVLESKLRHAEANEELRVFYQPQVSTEDEDIVGMEALIRWEHPELGLISPGFFIPLAEETGLIVPIGEWLMRRAIAQTREWHLRFGLPLKLGVNLSPLQLKQPNLVTVVEQALNAAELEPRYLDLEVTESLSIKSIPGLRERLEALRELGCSISIDDFGTGQASLDYLKRFPADRIKIDQSFVRNIGVDPDDEAIVSATIAMAHRLKLGVIAEGVEEEDHLEFLRRHDCDECQGYLFCRPLPTDAFSRMLLERESLTSAGAQPAPGV